MERECSRFCPCIRIAVISNPVFSPEQPNKGMEDITSYIHAINITATQYSIPLFIFFCRHAAQTKQKPINNWYRHLFCRFPYIILWEYLGCKSIVSNSFWYNHIIHMVQLIVLFSSAANELVSQQWNTWLVLAVVVAVVVDHWSTVR